MRLNSNYYNRSHKKSIMDYPNAILDFFSSLPYYKFLALILVFVIIMIGIDAYITLRERIRYDNRIRFYNDENLKQVVKQEIIPVESRVQQLEQQVLELQSHVVIKYKILETRKQKALRIKHRMGLR